jgi:hypothetical protein
LLRGLKALDLPPEIVRALSPAGMQALAAIDPGKLPGADLTRILQGLVGTQIDPAITRQVAELVAKHPQYFTGPLDVLAKIEAGDHSSTTSTTKKELTAVEAQKVDPFRTGAAGRPTGGVDMVLREAARRISEGEIKPRRGGGVRQGFANSLHDWWEIERMKHDPPGPRVTSKTIYDRLSSLWNEAIRNS